MSLSNFRGVLNAIDTLTNTEKKALVSLLTADYSQKIAKSTVLKQKQPRKYSKRGRKLGMHPITGRRIKGVRADFVAKAEKIYNVLKEVGSATTNDMRKELLSRGDDQSKANVRNALYYIYKSKPLVRVKREGKSFLYYIKKEDY